MNNNENGKNIKLQPLGWLVIPDSIFNEGSEKVNWINLYYDNNGKITEPRTSNETEKTKEIKRRGFWKRLRG